MWVSGFHINIRFLASVEVKPGRASNLAASVPSSRGTEPPAHIPQHGLHSAAHWAPHHHLYIRTTAGRVTRFPFPSWHSGPSSATGTCRHSLAHLSLSLPQSISFSILFPPAKYLQSLPGSKRTKFPKWGKGNNRKRTRWNPMRVGTRRDLGRVSVAFSLLRQNTQHP